nr:MAG TPA: hypothetical protein [Caudoviricetes sp.]
MCSLLGSIAHMGTSKLHFRGCRKPRNLLFFFCFFIDNYNPILYT